MVLLAGCETTNAQVNKVTVMAQTNGTLISPSTFFTGAPWYAPVMAATNYFSTNTLPLTGGTVTGDFEVSNSIARVKLTSSSASSGQKTWTIYSFLGQLEFVQDDGAGTLYNYMYFDVASGRTITSMRPHLFASGIRVTGKATNDQLTASSLVASDSGKALTSVTIGTGLSYSGGVLAATGAAASVTNTFDANFTALNGTNIHLASGLNVTNLTNNGGFYLPYVTGDKLLVVNGTDHTVTNSDVNVSGDSIITTGFIVGDTSVQSAGTLIIGGTATLNGNMTFGDSINDIATFNAKPYFPNLTASRVLVLDAFKYPTNSSVTSVQLGYLGTATSDIQVQIDGKQPTNIVLTGWAGTPTNAVPRGLTNAGGANYSIINASNAPTWALKSISAGSGVTITDTLTNLSIAATGGGTGATNVFSSQFQAVNGTNMSLANSVPLTNATYVGLYGLTNLQTVASAATNWLVDLSTNQFQTIPQISANVNLILTNITAGANVTLRIIGSASQQYTITLPSGTLMLSNTSTNQLNTNKVGLATFTSFGTASSNVFVGWTATP